MPPLVKGIICALAACLVWGLIFVIPYYIHGFDSFETALGRHFVYGSLSLILLLGFNSHKLREYSRALWGRAFLFALVANIVYYSCVVCGVRYSSPSITALILGVSPVVIAFYGNWQERQCHTGKLVLPAFCLLIGLAMVNWPVFQEQQFNYDYLVGIAMSCIATVAWCWFVVANALFLKKNPEIAPAEWSTLVGTATLFWVLALGIGYEAWHGAEYWQRLITPSAELASLVMGCLILGIVCSWFGASLWNTASANLPIALAGQLTIFETVFGVLLDYGLQQKLPPTIELSGMVLMVGAIMYSIYLFQDSSADAVVHN
jgi:drug/metabolite transporter (DMT)-like permease